MSVNEYSSASTNILYNANIEPENSEEITRGRHRGRKMRASTLREHKAARKHKKIKTIESIFDFNDITKFTNVILYKLPVDIHHSKSYFYMCRANNVQFLTKMSYHVKNEPEIYGSTKYGDTHGQDAEIKILGLLKELLYGGVTPCIVEMITAISGRASKFLSGTKCESISPSRDMGTEREIYVNVCIFKKMIRAGLAFDKVSFVVLERCDISFRRLLSENHNMEIIMEIIKSILFQIIYTLYAIKKRYPTFRHYDLHSNNIMIKMDDDYKYDGRASVIMYSFDGKQCAVPYFGLVPKIIDFGFSSIPELNINNSILNDKYMKLYRSDNDLMHLLHDIYSLDKRYYKLLHMIDPDDNFTDYDIDKISKIKLDYSKILTCDLFSDYVNDARKCNENRNKCNCGDKCECGACMHAPDVIGWFSADFHLNKK